MTTDNKIKISYKKNIYDPRKIGSCDDGKQFTHKTEYLPFHVLYLGYC